MTLSPFYLSVRQLFIFFSFTLTLLFVACQGNGTPTPAVCLDLCVEAEFQTFYQENGGERIFGKPHTGKLLTADGQIIQYFDGARLVYDPTTQTIAMTPLGSWAYEGLEFPITAAVPSSNESQTIAGFTVQDEFLRFYQNYGGEKVLGKPISPQLDEGELRVQYFENARLEWHPEAPADQQVQVGQLGRAHYLYEAYDPFTQPVAILDNTERVNSALVTAAVSAPILYEGETQTLYVVVQNPKRQPLANMEIVLTINGQPEQVLTEQTDALGTVQTSLNLPSLTAGETIDVEISVRYPGEQEPIGETMITFQTWW